MPRQPIDHQQQLQSGSSKDMCEIGCTAFPDLHTSTVQQLKSNHTQGQVLHNLSRQALARSITDQAQTPCTLEHKSAGAALNRTGFKRNSGRAQAATNLDLEQQLKWQIRASVSSRPCKPQEAGPATTGEAGTENNSTAGCDSADILPPWLNTEAKSNSNCKHSLTRCCCYCELS